MINLVWSILEMNVKAHLGMGVSNHKVLSFGLFRITVGLLLSSARTVSLNCDQLLSSKSLTRPPIKN